MFNRGAWLAFLLLVLSACGGSNVRVTEDGGIDLDAGEDSDAGADDAGKPRDAGVADDAGTAHDAGSESDAGVERDAGSDSDAGTDNDAGGSADGGSDNDAGSGSDAGIDNDAGSGSDAGIDNDAGSDSDAGIDNDAGSDSDGGPGDGGGVIFGADGGAGNDGGNGADAGSDAGVGSDAGAGDAGSSGDAGIGSDAGVGSDAGIGSDAGVGSDAGTDGGSACNGVITAEPNDDHTHIPVGTPITYPSNPPAGGPHWPVWAEWGVHTDTVPVEYLVHNEEHGGVVIFYNLALCTDGCPNLVSQLTSFVESQSQDPLCTEEMSGVLTRMVLTPDPDLDVIWAAAVWGWTYKVSSACVDTTDLQSFTDAHYAQGSEDECTQGGYQ